VILVQNADSIGHYGLFAAIAGAWPRLIGTELLGQVTTARA
jgi:hypothetical protein